MESIPQAQQRKRTAIPRFPQISSSAIPDAQRSSFCRTIGSSRHSSLASVGSLSATLTASNSGKDDVCSVLVIVKVRKVGAATWAKSRRIVVAHSVEAKRVTEREVSTVQCESRVNCSW